MLDRRRVLRTLAGLFLAMAGPGAYAAVWEPGRQNVTRYRLTPRGWPEGRRLRLAILSDLHVGSLHVPLSRVSELVAATNALAPDLTLLLGDFVASRARIASDPSLADLAAELARLQARDGVFAVLGNHDWWHDEPTQQLRRGPTRSASRWSASGSRFWRTRPSGSTRQAGRSGWPGSATRSPSCREGAVRAVSTTSQERWRRSPMTRRR